MRYQPATAGVDDDETHFIEDDGHWWLCEYDGDFTDLEAIRRAMQRGLACERPIDVREWR